ncbi:MAG: Vi polysaccharide biosynthesis protein VipA/TviB [Candidatus Endolissoclinum sp. TMED37]|nr:MAG: Vi polysaccharide biosynthesis protein VipA/TviB [Candidatus Endolissoclinum sp. TMED37]
MSLKNKRIAIIGLGYVGLPLAVEFGKYRNVIGFDIDTKRVKSLSDGVDETCEIEPFELGSAKNLVITSDKSKLCDAEVYIVTVPTPVDSANDPDLSALEKASLLVGNNLSDGNVVIYESTVYPGVTEDVCVPILESASGLKPLFADYIAPNNKGFYVGYSPERINPGDKSRKLANIIKVTSGSTPAISEAINEMYKEIIQAGTHLAPTIKVAEASKVIENTQRDLNIAFVNELSIIFSKLQIDTSDVLQAASTKWNFLPFYPGLVGGHCIGVDPFYLTYKANTVGYRAQVILAARRINDEMARITGQNIVKAMAQNKIPLKGARVGVFGISFKANCSDIRNTKIVDLITELEAWGLQVIVSDPLVRKEEVSDKYGIKILEIDKINQLDSIVIAVGHDQFKSLSPKELMKKINPGLRPVLGDIPAIIPKEEAKKQGFSVVRL